MTPARIPQVARVTAWGHWSGEILKMWRIVRRSSGYALGVLGPALASLATINLCFVNGLAPGVTPAAPEVPHGIQFRLLCILLLLASALLCRLGRRLVTPSAAEVIANDPRPPVLLLRSFADDHRRLKQDTLFSAAWWGVRAMWGPPRQEPPFNLPSLEELISSVLSRVGPVVAIGLPGEILPPAGAAREWATDATWQQRVEALLRECQLVVMVVGETNGEDGLAWEVRKVFEMGLWSKLVLVAPPLSEVEVRERWQKYHELSGGRVPLYRGWELCAAFHLDRVLLGAGTPVDVPQSAPFWVCSVRQSATGQRTPEEYRLGLESLDFVELLALRNVGRKPVSWRRRIALAVWLGVVATLLVWMIYFGGLSAMDLRDEWRWLVGE